MKSFIFTSYLFLCTFYFDVTAQESLFRKSSLDDYTTNLHDNMKAADFDADGFLDLISTSMVSGKCSLNILKNDSLKFTFYGNVIPDSDSIVYEVSDINNDGFVDIISNQTLN